MSVPSSVQTTLKRVWSSSGKFKLILFMIQVYQHINFYVDQKNYISSRRA
jgi:hypothetical protein